MSDDLVSALRAALGKTHQACEKIKDVENAAGVASGALGDAADCITAVKAQLGDSMLVSVILQQLASGKRSTSSLAGDMHGVGERIEALAARVQTTIVHLELDQ